MPHRNNRSTRPTAGPFKPLKGLSLSASDEEEFLAALARIVPGEAVELEEEPAAPQAQPRRFRQLQRGVLKPIETLDLHGLSREEALIRARAFLQQAARQSWPAVVIVTGKGLHSQAGPVLRQAIEQLLVASPALVMEWMVAPRQYGGAGALVVFPRPQPS
jgi:DNA-nicking Smr family endonuclease